MKFVIEYDIFHIFPELRIGIVSGRGLQIRESLREVGNFVEDNIKIQIKRFKTIEKK